MGRNSGKIVLAIVSEVPVYLPGLSKIVRPFDQHGSWSEGLEANDDVREMELCLEVDAYRDILYSVLGLPPRSEIYNYFFNDNNFFNDFIFIIIFLMIFKRAYVTNIYHTSIINFYYEILHHLLLLQNNCRNYCNYSSRVQRNLTRWQCFRCCAAAWVATRRRRSISFFP